MNKDTKKGRPRNRRRLHSVVGRFWVIDTETPGEHEKSKTAIGPFPTLIAAKEWMRKDATETFLASDKSLRDFEGDWAAPMIIVEERECLRQVPSVSVKVSLVSANAGGQP